MIKKIFFTFSFSLLVFFSNAQIEFQKKYGGLILDWVNSIVQTADSGYIMLGSTKNFGAGAQDIYLIKTDQNGDTLWTRTFGGITDDEEGRSIAITPDGGYIIAGTTNSFGTDGDLILIKTNANGDMVWSKTYGGNLVEFCTGLQLCFDGGYLISAHTTSYGLGGNDVYLVRTDSVGSTLWTKTYGSGGGDFGYSVQQTADSGFIVAGGGLINGATGSIYLIKTLASGACIWSKTFGGSGDDLGLSVIQTADNGYCIAGATTSFGATAKDIYVVKTDVNGDTLWAKTYGGAGDEECNSIKQTTDGGYILTGYTNSFSGGDDLFIIKTDATGTIIWSKLIGGVSNAKDEGRSVITTNDGGYAVVGFTQSFGNGTDAIFLKTDSLGNSGCGISSPAFITGYPVSTVVAQSNVLVASSFIEGNPLVIQGSAPGLSRTICTPVSVNEETKITNQISIYPNPFSNFSILKISSLSSNENINFLLLDMQGRQVKNRLINNPAKSMLSLDNNNEIQIQISKDDLLPGMYFYHLITSDSKMVIGSGKVVIE